MKKPTNPFESSSFSASSMCAWEDGFDDAIAWALEVLRTRVSKEADTKGAFWSEAFWKEAADYLERLAKENDDD